MLGLYLCEESSLLRMKMVILQVIRLILRRVLRRFSVWGHSEESLSGETPDLCVKKLPFFKLVNKICK
jgi:hypothetical protein